MIYRRKTYAVLPEQVEVFTQFFDEYLLPNQLKHGAELLGRWVNADRTEVMALWRYTSLAEYERIEAAIRKDDLHARARARREELGPLFQASQQSLLEATGQYGHPRKKVAASAFVTNEEAEAPHAAAIREVLEETGIAARLTGLSGVYHNDGTGMVALIFRAGAIGGTPRTSAETAEIQWVKLTCENLAHYITRPQYAMRVLDALQGAVGAYQTYAVQPYLVTARI